MRNPSPPTILSRGRFGRLQRTAAVLAIAIACMAPSARAPAAEMAKAEIAASPEKGFGRLIITFKDRTLLPQYTTRLTGGVLVLQFAEPVQIDVDRLPMALPDYVNIARRDPDGKALRFSLGRQIRINTIDAGEKLFVDLLPSTWKGQPPPLPPEVVAELAKRTEAALKAQRESEKQRFGVRLIPKLDFRVGRHPTFTRLSFGWNMPFDTQMARESDRVILTFNRLAEIDFTPILVDPPQALKEIGAEPDGDKLKIIMEIAPEADVRAFREDQTYVIDISGANKPSDSPQAEIRKALEAARGAVPEGAKGLVNAPGIAKPAAAAATPPAAAPASGDGKAPAGRAAVAPVPQGPVRVVETPLPAEGAPAPAPAPADMPAGGGAPAVMAGGEARPEGRDGQSSIRIVRVEAKKLGTVVRLAFPFPEKTASAAFKRDDSVWVVFDSTLPMDTRAIAAALGASVRDVTVNRTEKGQTLRIRLTEPMLATMGADGNSWILSIGEMVLEPAKPLALAREFQKAGRGILKVALADPGSVHEIIDPEVGDRLFAVTAQGPARGLLKSYSLPELDTLSSAHGIAIVPRTDDLNVTIDNGQVIVSRQPGLTLSTGSIAPASLSVPLSGRNKERRKVDGATFQARDPIEFTGTVRDLIERVAAADTGNKTKARFDLAEFYIANRFALEALGVLRLAALEQAGIERDPAFITLAGAAQAMTGRHATALRTLAHAEVAESVDAALWRTVAATGAQKWDEAREASLKGAAAVGGYPPDVQALFNLSAAEAAVELNDYNLAQARLADVVPSDIDNDLRGRYEILQARVADAAGRPEDAMERLGRAESSGDRRAKAEAEYRRLRILVRDGKIEPAEAVDRLKSLAFDWRGDEQELKTLRFLSKLQAEHGLFRDAFQNLRTAAMVGPESPTTRLLQDEMNKEFVSLYLDGKADKLKPLDALSVYYDFREMTPIGRLGDEIVRKLADRLVGVDLLDQAAELLGYQIDNRLRGAARAQIAADLAVIHLLNHKPDRALAVLNKTRHSQLPTSVERQRRVVEARALSDTGRADLALELVGPLSGSDIDRLKADILWRGKRWGEASERIEVMLGGRWSEGPPLDAQERQDVIRAAVGFVLAGDALGLARLRNKFAAKMKDSPNARTFDVVTAPIQSQGSEFREIARELAAVDTMRGFLDEYRNQYMKAQTGSGTEPPAADPEKDAPAAAAPAAEAPAKPEAAKEPSDKSA